MKLESKRKKEEKETQSTSELNTTLKEYGREIGSNPDVVPPGDVFSHWILYRSRLQRARIFK